MQPDSPGVGSDRSFCSAQDTAGVDEGLASDLLRPYVLVVVHVKVCPYHVRGMYGVR